MVSDGFGERLYDLGRATRVCLPVDKNGEDASAPEHAAELLCARARLARTRPRQPRFAASLVSTVNQLGPEVLTLGPPRELCVWVTAAEPSPAPTPTVDITATPTTTATVAPSPAPTATGDTPIRISLRPPDIARLPTEVKHFWATGHLADGTTRDLTDTVVWASSDPAVALAPNDPNDPNRMDLVAPGTAMISATDPASGVSTTATGDDATLHVTGPLSHILLHPFYARAPAGGFEQLTAVGVFANGTGPGSISRNLTQDVVWSTSAPDVARADNLAGDRSRIVAVAPGQVDVRATDPATGISATSRFATLGDLVAIYLNPAGPPFEFARLRVGQTGRLYAVGLYDGGGSAHITQQLVFRSLDPSIIVTPNLAGDRGLFEAVGGGRTQITATDPATGLTAVFWHTIYGEVLDFEIPAFLLRPRKFPVNAFYRPFRNLVAIYAHGTGGLFGYEWEVAVDDPTAVEVRGNLVRGLHPGGVSAGVRDLMSGAESTHRISIAFYGELELLLLSPETMALRVGDEDQLTALSDQNGGVQVVRTQEVLYTSSAPAIVAAPNDYPQRSRIVALAPGEATISARLFLGGAEVSTSDSGDDAYVTVVGDLTSLTITPTHAVTAVGRAARFTATGADAAGRTINLTQKVAWMTDAAPVAAANNPTGDRSRIDGVGSGTATVSVSDPVSGLTSSDTGGNATLTVLGAIDTILLLPETLPLLPGTEFQLTAIGSAPDGTLNVTQDMTYVSDDPSVVEAPNAEEDRSRIVAVAPGTARITAVDPVSGLLSSETVVTVPDPLP
jgi:hypothetical protein